jgi:hypothetical protein
VPHVRKDVLNASSVVLQHDTFITHTIVFLFSFPALLMIIAWILFTGLATIIARYFKSSFGQKMTCGSKIWFQVTICFCNNTFSFHQGEIEMYRRYNCYIVICFIDGTI